MYRTKMYHSLQQNISMQNIPSAGIPAGAHHHHNQQLFRFGMASVSSPSSTLTAFLVLNHSLTSSLLLLHLLLLQWSITRTSITTVCSTRENWKCTLQRHYTYTPVMATKGRGLSIILTKGDSVASGFPFAECR
jgi:hypothetical protein